MDHLFNINLYIENNMDTKLRYATKTPLLAFFKSPINCCFAWLTYNETSRGNSNQIELDLLIRAQKPEQITGKKRK